MYGIGSIKYSFHMLKKFLVYVLEILNTVAESPRATVKIIFCSKSL